MSNAVGHLVSFTPDGDNAKFGVSIFVLNGWQGQLDVFIPITSLNNNIAQINAEVKAAVQAAAEANGATFSGGDKVILLCGLV